MSEGLERLVHSQFEQMVDTPNVNCFLVDHAYRYKFFTRAHARVMREIWGVEIAVGMDAARDVIRDDQDLLKVTNNFYWAFAGNEFEVRESFGLAHTRRLFVSRYRPTFSELSRITGIAVCMTDVNDRYRPRAEVEAVLRPRVCGNCSPVGF